MSRIKGNLPCPHCGSSDAVSLYRNELAVVDGACFSCGSYIDPHACSEHYGDMSGLEGKPKMTKEELEKTLVRIQSKPERGIRDRRVTKDTCAFYGVRVDYDGEEVIKHYYPLVDATGKIDGYKVKNTAVKAAKNEVRACKERGETPDGDLLALAKSAAPFYTLGNVNRKSPLFGQHLFTKGQRVLVICEGELDALSVFQVLRNKEKGYNTPCVSVTIGSEAAVDQVRSNWEYVSSFEKVYVAFDNDDAGKQAAKAVLRLLKPQQGYHMKLRRKDLNDYLMNDDVAGIREAYFNAEPFSSVEVVEASNTLSLLIERAGVTKISFPKNMDKLNEMYRGGLALGEITVIAAPTSCGKTTLVSELIHHWITATQYKVGVASLEADLAETVENLLSISLNKRLANLDDKEKISLYKSDEIAREHKLLTQNELGDDKFALLNHQGSLSGNDDLITKIEIMVKQHGCQIIIVDPLQLGMSGKSLEDTDEFMSNLLKLTKETNIAVVLVAHVRKSGSGEKSLSEGGVISEESIKGSGSIIQVAFNTILLYRNKMAEDETERNTIHMLVSKNRRAGNTGTAGALVYNSITGRLNQAKVVPAAVRDTELFGLLDEDAKKDAKVTALLESPVFNRPPTA